MWAGLLIALNLHLFGTSTIQSYVCQPPATPAIVTPMAGSTVYSGAVSIAGDATAGSTVEITDNSQLVLELTADNSNTFSGQATLSPGEHTLGVASNSPCGNKAGADTTFQAVAPPTPPPTSGGTVSGQSGGGSNLSFAQPKASGSSQSTNPASTDGVELAIKLTAPPNNSVSKAVSRAIIGSTTIPATIEIAVNGTVRATTKVPSSTFNLTVPLVVGDNFIEITATAGGQTAEVELYLTRTTNIPIQTYPTHMPWYQTTLAKIIFVVIASCVILWLLWWLEIFVL